MFLEVWGTESQAGGTRDSAGENKGQEKSSESTITYWLNSKQNPPGRQFPGKILQ